MSATVKLKLIAEIKDISSHALVKSSDASRSWGGLGDIDETLSATSTPDVENVAAFIATLTAGAVTIDWTALTHADGDTRSAAGKKLRFIQIMNPAANTANIVVTKGASNGYSPVGTTFTIPISPGGGFLWYLQSDAADVTNGSADTWDVTGSGSETFYVKAGWG